MNLRKNHTASVNVEQLEDRLIPAVSFNLNSAGLLHIKSNDAADTIRVTQTATRVDIQGAPFGYKASAVKGILVEGNGGGDFIDLARVAIPATIYGGSGHDRIYGGQASDKIFGGANDDRIWAGGGNDIVHGDGGDDRLFGNAGYDYLFGDYGTDFMDDCNRTGHEYYANQNDGSLDFIADMVAPAGKAAPSQLKQGSQNYTCWYLATLTGLVQSGVNPSSYISYAGYTNEGVGIYNVSLHNGRSWVKVPVLFEGHTVATDARMTTDYASWTAIMSRAFNYLNGNRGGQPANAFRALGRKPSVVTQFSNATFNSLASAMSRGYAAVVGTGNSVASGLMETRHAYQVAQLRVVNGAGMVLLRNPWGTDGGKSVPRNAPGFNDGYFWITWNDLARSVSSLTIG